MCWSAAWSRSRACPPPVRFVGRAARARWRRQRWRLRRAQGLGSTDSAQLVCRFARPSGSVFLRHGRVCRSGSRAALHLVAPRSRRFPGQQQQPSVVTTTQPSLTALLSCTVAREEHREAEAEEDRRRTRPAIKLAARSNAVADCSLVLIFCRPSRASINGSTRCRGLKIQQYSWRRRHTGGHHRGRGCGRGSWRSTVPPRRPRRRGGRPGLLRLPPEILQRA